MKEYKLKFIILPGKYGVCRLDDTRQIPEEIRRSKFYTITKTSEELSLVCCEDLIPIGVNYEKDWKILKITGPLDFALVGILAAISGILAEEGISIFAVSTYDTDYILIKEPNLEKAITVLRAKGHSVK